MKAYLLLFVVILTGCGYTRDAAETTFNETKASSLLKKYSRFKDMYSALNSKKSSIQILDGKITSLRAEYKGVSRKDWAQEDIQTINQWASEKDALKMSYNNLAGEYNSDMAKFNLNFTNRS